MAVLVQKYGGSSVADVTRIGVVADRVVAAKKAGWDVVVVVSAMGKATDDLLALARRVAEASPGQAHAPHMSEPPRRELDMLLSTGERVTMALLSIAIHGRGAEAISFTGSQSGILTNDRHFDARIIEVRPHRIEDELARGKIVIVAGYQGMSYKREITTLGRGGSDTTAVALAAALGAERCEIYSDVDGVYTADPRVVAGPLHLPELDLATLAEMSECGAKVLNAQAVEWARRSKVVLHARRTSDPLPVTGPVAGASPLGGHSGIPRETVASETARARVRAVVGQERVVLARVPRQAFPAWSAAAARLDVPLLDVALGADEAACVIPLLNLPDWARCRLELDRAAAGGGSYQDGLGLVSLVGDGLVGMDGLVRFCAVLEGAGATPGHVTAHPLRLGATVPSDRLGDAQRALHAAYVEAEARRTSER